MKSSVLAALTLVAISSVAFASTAGEPRSAAGAQAVFTRADANHDGKVSLEEVRTEAATRFVQADANKNGVLEADELRVMQAKAPGQDGFAAQDRDGNGSLSRDEAPARLRGRFDQVDANHDGKLERAELQAARQNGARNPQPRDPRAMITRSDKDGNGTLSRQEAPARMKTHFDRLDSNKNGQIEAQELTAARATRTGPDLDHDGKISLLEFTGRAVMSFTRMDTNHDGLVSMEELRAQRHNRRPNR